MQKNPATLTEAIKEAMQLELINEMTRAKANNASLADMEGAKLEDITDELEDLTIKRS